MIEEICSLHLIHTNKLMASDRDEQLLSRYHQGEARFNRT